MSLHSIYPSVLMDTQADAEVYTPSINYNRVVQEAQFAHGENFPCSQTSRRLRFTCQFMNHMPHKTSSEVAQPFLRLSASHLLYAVGVKCRRNGGVKQSNRFFFLGVGLYQRGCVSSSTADESLH